LIEIKSCPQAAAIIGHSPVPDIRRGRTVDKEAIMYGTFSSLVGGLALAVGLLLLAEKAARWVEADAKRRAGPEQPAG
jgi:hypothetical protein